MDYNEFALKVKTKYPQYGNVDNRELAERVVKKYPQYASSVSFDNISEPKVPSTFPSMEAGENDLIPISQTQPKKTTSAQTTPVLKTGIEKNAVSVPKNTEPTPYMQIANNPNLTKEQKAAAINAQYQKEIGQAEIDKQEDIKEWAKSELDRREKDRQNHPVLGTLNKFMNPVHDANENYLQEIAEYGTNAPLDVKVTNTLERGAMGGLTTAADVLPMLKGAQAARGAQIAAQTANTASKASKLANIGKAAGHGALGFGLQEFADSTEDLLNNRATGKDVAERTTRGAITGGVLGGMAGGIYKGLGKSAEDIVRKTAENRVYPLIAQAQKQGQAVTVEQVENLIQKEIANINDNIVTGALIKTGKAVPAAAADTATMAAIDYGINSAQGKQELSFPEQLKAYAPFTALSLVPSAMHVAGKPAQKVLQSNAVKNTINKSGVLSNFIGEISNALNVEAGYDNAKKYQELGKQLQGYDMPAEKHYTSNEINLTETVKNLSPKQKRMFLNYVVKGFSKEEALEKTIEQSKPKTQSKFEEMSQKAEEQKQTEKQLPAVYKEPAYKEAETPLENVQQTEKTPSENVKIDTKNPSKNDVLYVGDINTPIEGKTPQNDPYLSTQNERFNYESLENNSKKENKTNIDISDDKVTNEAWGRTVGEYFRKAVNKSGGSKVLDRRFNSYNSHAGTDTKSANDFYNTMRRRIELQYKSGKINGETANKMFNQLNAAAERFEAKTGVKLNKAETAIPEQMKLRVEEPEQTIETKETEPVKAVEEKKEPNLEEYVKTPDNNDLWVNAAETAYKPLAKKYGAIKYLKNRINSYKNDSEKLTKFCKYMVNKINKLNQPDEVKQRMIQQLKDTLGMYGGKTGRTVGNSIVFKPETRSIKHIKTKLPQEQIQLQPERKSSNPLVNAVENTKTRFKKYINTVADSITKDEYNQFSKQHERDLQNIQKADKVYSVKEYAKTDKEFAEYFKDNIDDNIHIIYTELSGNTNGLCSITSSNIFINSSIVKNKTKEDIGGTIRHEYQHALDFKEILEDKELLKEYLKTNKKYQEVRNHLHESDEYTYNVHNYLRKTKGEKIANDIIYGISELKPLEYREMINKYVDKGIITRTDADRLIERNEYHYVYRSNPLERRVNNAKYRISNEPITQELGRNDLGRTRGVRGVASHLHVSERTHETRGNSKSIQSNDGDRNVERTSERTYTNNDKTISDNSYEQTENKYTKVKPREHIDDIPTKEELSDVAKEYAHIMRRISKDMEKKRIKRGLITPEQAENRKKQISKGDDVAYVPMYSGNTPVEETIDITRNYNAGRESKVGLYGRATVEGVRKKMTADDAVKNLYTASIKTNFIDNIADYVEKNFAKPIKNGHTEKGYVAVNAHLLWNGLASKASPEWYDLISKGEEAIRKAYKNEKQADFFVELHNRTKEKDFQIPEQVFKKLLSGEGETAKEAFERYGKSGYSWGKLAGELSDAFTDQFKRNVLGTASFWVNNRFSNQLMLAANSKNPARYILDLYQAGKIKSKDMPQELLENSILEAVKNSTKRKTYTGYNNIDNIINLFGGHNLSTTELQQMIKLNKKFSVNNENYSPAKLWGARAANVVIGFPNKVYNKIANTLLEFNSKFEDYERKVALVQQLDKNKKELLKQTGQQMLTIEEALKHLDKNPEMKATIVNQVQDVLGDYNNFSHAEKNVLKRLIPFYSWYRTVARNSIHLAKNNPARFVLILKELEKLKKEDKDLKDYQKGSFRLPIKDKKSGKQLLINKVNQVPWETLYEFRNRDDAKRSINPLIKVAGEAITGEKWFGSGEITNKRYVSKYIGKAADGENSYKYYDTKENKYIDSLPVSTRLGYAAKELGKNYTPLLSNRLIGGESLIQGALNYKKNGKFIEPDKVYDADLGGFSHGDKAGSTYSTKNGYKSIKRYAANNTSEEIKLLNRLGLSLQTKNKLSKADIKKLEDERLKQRTKEYKKKHKK